MKKKSLPTRLIAIFGAGAFTALGTVCPAADDSQRDGQSQPPSEKSEDRSQREQAQAQRQSPSQDQQQNPQLSNENLKQEIKKKIDWDSGVAGNEIDVTVDEGNVTLDGQVSSFDQVRRAAMVARSRQGVENVINNLTVAPGDLSDEQVRTQVEAALADERSLMQSGIDVKVSEGKVTLSGEVKSHAKKTKAENVVADLAGVRNVENQLEVAMAEKKTDDEIKQSVEKRYRDDAWLDENEIIVAVADGIVTLTGTVPSADAKERAQQKAQPWANDVVVTGLMVVPESTVTEPSKTDDPNADDTTTASTDRIDPDKQRDRQDGKTDQDGKSQRLASQMSDDEIKQAIRDSFQDDARLAETDLEIDVNDGQVTLSGDVTNRLDKTEAARHARNINGVKMVSNEIEVDTTASSGETDPKERISNALARNSELRDDQIQVEVQEGTASLMGKVDSSYEKNKAETIASGIDGISQVDNQLEIDSEQPTGFTYYEFYGFPDYTYRTDTEETTATDSNADTDRQRQDDEAIAASSGMTDSELKEEVEDEIFWSWFVDSDDVQVSVQNGEVTLTGTVEDLAEKEAAAKNARDAGATQIDNNLTIAQN